MTLVRLELKRQCSEVCSSSPLQRQINCIYPRPRCNINATANDFPEKRVIAKHITLRLRLAFTNKCHSGFTLDRKSRWRRSPHPLAHLRLRTIIEYFTRLSQHLPVTALRYNVTFYSLARIVLGPKLLMSYHVRCIKLNSGFKMQYFTSLRTRL